MTTRPDLDARLAAVETHLASLGEALRARDASAIDRDAAELQRALVAVVDAGTIAARSGALTPAMRRRLAAVGGQVAAQRESLARASAAVDRAIGVLLPASGSALYGADGAADRAPRGGMIQA